MKKFGAYSIMILGALMLILTPVISPLGISKSFLLILGVIVLIVGLVLSLGKPKEKEPEEVPVFEGEGKKIVAYRRHAKK